MRDVGGDWRPEDLRKKEDEERGERREKRGEKRREEREEEREVSLRKRSSGYAQ